ncbi:MocR-like pyridoxine biosynthesis transcription factor PdxR [Desmospora profundinema]|uniref:DNA-binding transcriptional MocR family regulator n=1 Tax=Desmospora profundinema TaxID=1571184 RepID=A0ABU1IRM0_9BACL|nr:PLP-dependent aminotransferase family protein [Desmospora profundinema]MDR6226809.1 DNA-binding transcriptional MocR family regulator [Desmospora profundinema]
MKIDLNRSSKIPLVKQISQALEDRIRSEHLKKGERLSSVRKMANDLGVSPVTVIKAYDLLEKEGLVTRVHGKGTFVYGEAESKACLYHQPAQTITDYMHRSQYLMYTQRRKRVDLSSSTVQTELLPLPALLESVQHLMEKEPEVLCQYGDIKGDGELRKAASNYLTYQGVSVDSNELLITNGSQQGIDLVARCFLRPGDVVITEETTYSAAIDTFRGTGATILPVPMDRDGLRVDKLTALCDTYQPRLIYTIPTFHNPTGTVMSLKRRGQLLQLAESIPCLIVEDDPWSEIYFDDPPPPSIKSLDSTGNVIYLKGLSKILSPGCRIGLLAASGPVLKRLLIAKTNSDLGSPLLTQRAILPLLQAKKTQTYFQQLRKALKERRDLVVRCLQEHAPPGIDWLIPSGGFNLWLTLPRETNAHDLLHHTEKENISFLPGSACFSSDPSYHCLRISFSSAPNDILYSSIKEFCRILTDYLEKRPSEGIKPIF